MTKSIITKDQFLAVELKDISQVYYGKRECCRCGCGGTYTATTFMKKPRTNVIDDTIVQKRLDRAKRLVRSGADFDAFGNGIDVKTGANTTLTFYFDELK